MQPSSFGGFGTHAPGTTIQSVVSRLHLRRETNTNGHGKTTSFIAWYSQSYLCLLPGFTSCGLCSSESEPRKPKSGRPCTLRWACCLGQGHPKDLANDEHTINNNQMQTKAVFEEVTRQTLPRTACPGPECFHNFGHDEPHCVTCGEFSQSSLWTFLELLEEIELADSMSTNTYCGHCSQYFFRCQRVCARKLGHH